MSIPPLRYYNSKWTFQINNVEGEFLCVPVVWLLRIALIWGARKWLLSLPVSGSSVFRMAVLKNKIYSVIKYRAITLRVKNSHRGECWVLGTPTETIWSLHSKWQLQFRAAFCPLWGVLLRFQGITGLSLSVLITSASCKTSYSTILSSLGISTSHVCWVVFIYF